jgi:hypothetical protein
MIYPVPFTAWNIPALQAPAHPLFRVSETLFHAYQHSLRSKTGYPKKKGALKAGGLKGIIRDPRGFSKGCNPPCRKLESNTPALYTHRLFKHTRE